MKSQKIQLKTFVSGENKKILKHGIAYYSWVKSHKHNCYYLIPCKRLERLRRISGLLGIFIAMLAISVLYFYKISGLFNAIIISVFFNVMSWLAGVWYYYYFCQIINQLPSLPIGVVNIDKGYLIIRNLDKMPFVQIPGNYLKIDITKLKRVSIYSAYKIYNGNTTEWDLVGYVPSWSSLSICYETIHGNNAMQLLFVGAKIPEDLLLFFTTNLSMKLDLQENYSRFET